MSSHKPIPAGRVAGRDAAVYEDEPGCWIGLVVRHWYGDGHCHFDLAVGPNGVGAHILTDRPYFSNREEAELALAAYALVGEEP